jgi:NAD(P)H-hydrate epimerase
VPVRQRVWTARAAAARVPARPAGSHKGSFGHVLVIGGSEGKTGAAVLAAEGALHTGAGLVTVAAPRSLHAVFESQLTEAMSLPLEDGGDAAFGSAALAAALEAAAARDVVVLGPGLGASQASAQAAREFLAALDRPAVVDADGLNAFAGEPEALRSAAPRVLTPHPGEMGRLLGTSSAEVQADRVAAARALARRSGAVTVLKGARTLVAQPDGELLVNPTGGPGLATGGTGDVLAGVIGALLAQGLAPHDAAGLGAWLHGRAGERLGPVTVARAVAEELPAVLGELRAAAEDTGERHLLRRFR